MGRGTLYPFVMGGHLKTLERLWNKYPHEHTDSLHCDGAFTGRLDALEWLCKRHPEIEWNRVKCANDAARQGHLEILKWIVDRTDDSLRRQDIYKSCIDIGMSECRRNLAIVIWCRDRQVGGVKNDHLLSLRPNILAILCLIQQKGLPIELGRLILTLVYPKIIIE